VATSTAVGTDTLTAIENYIGSQGNDSITVNGGINVIDGQAGNDTINAGGNNDTVFGGIGNDTLNGEAGNDTMDGGADNDTLRGGAGNDTLAGGTGNDIFQYVIGDGVDAVDGGLGSDTLNILGTAAANTLDVIFSGTITQFEGGTVTGVEAVTADLLGGADRLSYAGSTSGVAVDLPAGTASGFSSIAGIENVTDGSGADTLRANGNAQNNNLAGGLGDDTYFADNGDTITEAAGAGTDQVFTTSAAFTLAANVENLTFNGVGNFTGTGNGSDNVITGNGGADVLNGAGGNDTLIGNGGIDSLNGGAGDDILIGGAGNDLMNGGANNDTFVFAAAFGADTITGFDANATGGQDLLDIRLLGVNAGNFAARVSILDLGTDTLVTIDGTNTITLLGVNGNGANLITQQDFIFA
jgi:Ca2+-binding RTX toxin-like protein